MIQAALLCGWTDDLGWLIAFRVLQGLGGGLLGANSIAILVTSVPPEKRSHAIGLFTTAQAIGYGLIQAQETASAPGPANPAPAE